MRGRFAIELSNTVILLKTTQHFFPCNGVQTAKQIYCEQKKQTKKSESLTLKFGIDFRTGSIRWQISKYIKYLFDILALALTASEILSFEIVHVEKVDHG